MHDIALPIVAFWAPLEDGPNPKPVINWRVKVAIEYLLSRLFRHFTRGGHKPFVKSPNEWEP